METKYVNIRIQGDPSSVVGVKHADYNETSTAPILEDPSEWSLAVVRFNLTTNEMPIYVFEDVQGSGVYKYKVILSVAGIREEIPIDFTLLGSKSPFGNTYALYSYTGIVDAMNQAFQTALFALQAEYALQIGPWPGTFPTLPPKFRLLESNRLQLFFEGSYPTNAISIGFNPALVNKLGAFSFNIQQTAPYDAFIDTSDKGWNHVTYNTIPYLFAQEPGLSIQNWNTVRQIVFKTSIPLESELRSGQSVDKDQILTDFDVLGVIDGTNITFTPNGPLREYPLYNRAPLYEISLKIMWRDGNGKDYDWNLGPDDLATLKIEFRKRY